MKIISHIVVLVAVFIGSVWFFGQNMKEEKFTFSKTVEMAEPTFPIVSIKVKDQVFNELHGLSGGVEPNNFRDSMVPLDHTQSFTVIIKENQIVAKKVMYRLVDSITNETVENGTISALERVDDNKTAKILLKEELQKDKEYSIVLTVVTDKSKKIHFVTRIKVMDQLYLKEQLDFVKEFHKATIEKEEDEVKQNEKIQEHVIYLETLSETEYTTLANVNINSKSSLIFWEDLKPTVVYQSAPTIKEIGWDTMAVELKYFVQLPQNSENGTVNNNEAPEEVTTYEVSEFYRIRYTSERMKLLYYHRTMETLFDMADVNMESGSISLGLTNDDKVDIFNDTNMKRMAFVRNGTLWCYDLEANRIVKVFSFDTKKQDYSRAGYNQHNVRILNLYDNGNMDFLVYGYMNRGDYEGRLGIILYKYFQEENRIEEQVYIPMQYSYEVIEENLDSFSYLSGLDVFYFSINNIIYSYNIISKQVQTIANEVYRESFLLSKKGQFIVWQDHGETKESKNITILNLENEKQHITQAKEQERIKLLGMIDIYYIYGYAKTSDIITTKAGADIVPLYKVEIADVEGNVVKSYQPKDSFVESIKVRDNTIELNRLVKSKQGYEKTDADYIVNKIVNGDNLITVEMDKTNEVMPRLQILMPQEFNVSSKPKVTSTDMTILSVDTMLHFEDFAKIELKYYVYAVGHLVDSYATAGEAIAVADALMGIVMDSNNIVIWERGVVDTKSTISSITMQEISKGYDSITACVSMVLKANKVSVSVTELNTKEHTIYDMLSEYLPTNVVNLTGSNLNQVLYYVSKKSPVIAMKNNSDAVLIIGYDENYLYYMDPSTGATEKARKTLIADLFETAGNVFLSYVK